MFNKKYWSKAKHPALMLVVCDIFCTFLTELVFTPGQYYFQILFIPYLLVSILCGQLFARITGLFVNLDKPGSTGMWINYGIWVINDIFIVLSYAKAFFG